MLAEGIFQLLLDVATPPPYQIPKDATFYHESLYSEIIPRIRLGLDPGLPGGLNTACSLTQGYRRKDPLEGAVCDNQRAESRVFPGDIPFDSWRNNN
jgi:hypothetical protein